jgi:DNA-binding SARP family transcriptional activator
MASRGPVAGLEFGILGPLEVRADGAPVELRREKERTLLAMLLLGVNEVVSLDHLAAGLWEDADAARRPATLRVHVSRLRQALAAATPAGESCIVTTPRGYELEIPVESLDAHRFEQFASDGRRMVHTDAAGAAEAFSAALGLWRGPVLGDLSLSPATEPGVARLEESRLSVVEDRIDADLRCGRHHELVGELERLVTDHPLRERLWGQRMVALYRSDRQADALRAYQDLHHLLAEELGISPSPTLQQLERAVLDQDPILDPPPPLARARDEAVDRPPAAPSLAVRFPRRLATPGELPFSGRRAELDALIASWRRAMTGESRIVLISGEAGVGKTRLAAELARHVAESGGAVLLGRCDEDVGAPFQPFSEALEQVVQAGAAARDLGLHAGELIRLLPDLDQRVEGLPPPLPADPDTELYLLFQATVDWLAAVSSPCEVLLVLDDLHWAAKPSLLLLRHLVRSPEPMRLLVVGTYRDSDVDAADPLTEILADLRREPGVERLALHGLDADEVEEMVAHVGRESAERGRRELAGALRSETAGNPFFVQEILRSLIESDGLTIQGVASSAGEAVRRAVPEGVREVIRRRLLRLSPAANQVMSAASVIGEDIDFDVLAAIVDLDEDQVLDALDEAAAALLLMESPSGSYEFSHAIVRSALYDELSAPRRTRRHRQVGEALEARGGVDAAVLAHHFRLGGADAEAAAYAATAGEHALRQLGFDRAVDLFSQALDAVVRAGAVPSRRCQLLIRLGIAQRMAGLAGSRETLLEAAALAHETGDTSLLVDAVLANNRGFASAAGNLDEARVRYIEVALDAVGPADAAVRARLLSLLALERMWDDPDLHRLALTDEAVAIARRLGDDDCRLDVAMAAQVTCAIPDRVPGLVDELPELVALAERDGHAQQLARVCLAGSTHRLELGDLDGADALIARVEKLAAELENPVFGWMAAHQHCRRLTVTGTGDEIEKAAADALRIGELGGQPDLVVWFAPQLFVARWSQGRLGEIVELARGALGDTPRLAAWRGALALALVAAGEHEEAVELVGELGADPAHALPIDVAWLIGHSAFAEAVAVVGTPSQAASEHALLLPYAGRIPCLFNVARPGVHLWLGALATRAGWTERADQHLADAHAQHVRLGAALWTARTELEWGRCLLASGDLDRGTALLSSAKEAAAGLGAVDVEAASSGLLADLG